MATGSPKKKIRTAGDRLRRGAERPEPFGESNDRSLENLIVIGASAGGHNAIKEVLQGVSDDIPAVFIIMQHMPKDVGSTSFNLGHWLRDSTRLSIRRIKQGDRLHRGVIYVTQPGESVFLKRRTLQLESQKHTSPVTTINRLFESAAQEYHNRVVGVVLTGLLSDGTAGLKAVHEAGGLTIVQDEAEYPEMPMNAMKDLPVTFCLRSRDIGLTLDILARRKTNFETGLAASVRILKERVALLIRLVAQSKRNPDTSEFLSAQMLALEDDLRSVQSLVNEAKALTAHADLKR